VEEARPVRWRATLEYDGAGFAGWQTQPDHRTVQDVVEATLATLVQHPVAVTPSGRTDAGVHAEAQVISFDLLVPRTSDAIRDGLNARLPLDVACIDAQIAPEGFHARHWVLRKRYRYTFLARRPRSALIANRAWHVRTPLDVPAMLRAAQVLLGRHDMSSFRAHGCGATHPVRMIEELSLVEDGELVHLVVVGNGFLRHMVRNIAGTLVQVGHGRRPESWVGEVLAARDRHAAGPTAPAHALTLAEVVYGEGPAPWKDDGAD